MYKHNSLQPRRALRPQREVINKLAGDNYRMVTPQDRIFFRNVYDHMIRRHDLGGGMSDLARGGDVCPESPPGVDVK